MVNNILRLTYLAMDSVCLGPLKVINNSVMIATLQTEAGVVAIKGNKPTLILEVKKLSS